VRCSQGDEEQGAGLPYGPASVIRLRDLGRSEKGGADGEMDWHAGRLRGRGAGGLIVRGPGGKKRGPGRKEGMMDDAAGWTMMLVPAPAHARTHAQRQVR